jgi:hypothetical protein
MNASAFCRLCDLAERVSGSLALLCPRFSRQELQAANLSVERSGDDLGADRAVPTTLFRNEMPRSRTSLLALDKSCSAVNDAVTLHWSPASRIRFRTWFASNRGVAEVTRTSITSNPIAVTLSISGRCWWLKSPAQIIVFAPIFMPLSSWEQTCRRKSGGAAATFVPGQRCCAIDASVLLVFMI